MTEGYEQDVDFDDEDEEFVDVSVVDFLKTSVLCHIAYGDLDEAITAVEDIFALGPVQSERLFDAFTGVILTASNVVDAEIDSLLENTLLKIKTGEIPTIELD